MLKRLICIQVIVWVAAVILPPNCFAVISQESVPLLRTPQDIQVFLGREFKYEMELSSYWQEPEETIRLRKGDCFDFALLAQELLKRMEISSQVLVIKFKNLKVAHAICVFKQGRFYSFISNQKLFYSDAASIEGLIAEYYPDWQEVFFLSEKKTFSSMAKK